MQIELQSSLEYKARSRFRWATKQWVGQVAAPHEEEVRRAEKKALAAVTKREKAAKAEKIEAKVLKAKEEILRGAPGQGRENRAKSKTQANVAPAKNKIKQRRSSLRSRSLTRLR